MCHRYPRGQSFVRPSPPRACSPHLTLGLAACTYAMASMMLVHCCNDYCLSLKGFLGSLYGEVVDRDHRLPGCGCGPLGHQLVRIGGFRVDGQACLAFSRKTFWVCMYRARIFSSCARRGPRVGEIRRCVAFIAWAAAFPPLCPTTNCSGNSSFGRTLACYICLEGLSTLLEKRRQDNHPIKNDVKWQGDGSRNGEASSFEKSYH